MTTLSVIRGNRRVFSDLIITAEPSRTKASIYSHLKLTICRYLRFAGCRRGASSSSSGGGGGSGDLSRCRLIKTAPPARGFTSGSASRFGSCSSLCSLRGDIRMIRLEIVPTEAIGAICKCLACSCFWVFLEDILDDADYLMSSRTNSPAPVSYSIVDAGLSGVTNTLHGVSSNGANRGVCVALSHENRVGCMAKVEAPSANTLLMCAEMITRRCWETESFRWHSLTRCLKSDYRDAIGKSNQTCSRSS
jgi:hypothetical protein